MRKNSPLNWRERNTLFVQLFFKYFNCSKQVILRCCLLKAEIYFYFRISLRFNALVLISHKLVMLWWLLFHVKPIFSDRTILYSCFQYQQDVPSSLFLIQYVPARCFPVSSPLKPYGGKNFFFFIRRKCRYISNSNLCLSSEDPIIKTFVMPELSYHLKINHAIRSLAW